MNFSVSSFNKSNHILCSSALCYYIFWHVIILFPDKHFYQNSTFFLISQIFLIFFRFIFFLNSSHFPYCTPHFTDVSITSVHYCFIPITVPTFLNIKFHIFQLDSSISSASSNSKSVHLTLLRNIMLNNFPF